MPKQASKFRTIKDTAEAWGISVRRVNMFIAEGRIPGVQRAGLMWLIPEEAKRPADGRRNRKPTAYCLADDLAGVIAASTVPMPEDNPDAILDAVDEERLRLIYACALAYLRGEFEQIIVCYQRLEGDDAARLRACPVVIAAAMCTGDYALYQQIEAWLHKIIQTNAQRSVTVIAEMALNTAYVSAIAPQMATEWLKTGDFSDVPPSMRIDAAFHRAKYFQGLGQYEAMLAVAETALAFCDSEEGILYSAVYLHTLRVAALCALGRREEAQNQLLEAMKRYLPFDFITPFTEGAAASGGLVETLLERELPEYYDAVIKRWERTIPNWLAFHNRFTKDNITRILSLREYQIARMAAQGDSYQKIARQFHVSQGRIANLMQETYSKLFVTGEHKRKKLGEYVF